MRVEKHSWRYLTAIVIVYGAGEALVGAIHVVTAGRVHTPGQRKQVWLRFGVWLLLGLEFELTADIVRSAISPTWTGIGQLGPIAVIRTFLDYFLEKDLERYERDEVGPRESQASYLSILAGDFLSTGDSVSVNPPPWNGQKPAPSNESKGNFCFSLLYIDAFGPRIETRNERGNPLPGS